jgi:hypothetical protein
MDAAPPGFGWAATGRRDIFLWFFKTGRIVNIPKERVCLFAFQKWTSYPLVVVMIALGIYLRLYSPIPKPYLAVLYIGLGLSLLVSSLQYYLQAIRTTHL